MTQRITDYLERNRPATPCLVVDLDAVEQSYRTFARVFASARIYYAVKANPEPAVIGRLAGLGAFFDTASPAEIALCLDQGVAAERIAYGSTIKKRTDIAFAHARGIGRFAFDSASELAKLAEAAPGSTVLCRISVDNSGADWPLSKKFGCSAQKAIDLLIAAHRLGLDPGGVSFHVGSQQTDTGQWTSPVASAAEIFDAVEAATGIRPATLNIGGGFPARYRQNKEPLEVYGRAIADAVAAAFGNRLPEIVLEPGRGMVADAGVIETEIVLIGEPEERDGRRWVYLDVGRYNGLAETAGEAIQYQIETPRDGGEEVPVVIAGPTCDSTDILYEASGYSLPREIEVGDRVRLNGTGAYTATYSAVNFNGLAPLRTYCI